jgi:hypothetical protein
MRVCVLILIALMFTSLHAKTLELSNTGSQSLSMTYLVPNSANGESLRIRFDLELIAELEKDEAAAAVCVNTANSSYAINGDNSNTAFGISFI